MILEIPNIHTFVSQLPSQMAAVLESGLLRHLFSLWSDPSAALRLTYWLEHTLGYGNGVPRLLLCYVGVNSSEYKIASC